MDKRKPSRHQQTLTNQRRIGTLSIYEKMNDEKTKKAREAFHHRAFEEVRKNAKEEKSDDSQ